MADIDPALAVKRANIEALRDSGAELYEEFSARPVGKHSPNLQLLLLYMRGAPVRDKHVLVAETPHKSWVLGQLTGVRGDPVRLHPKARFTDLDEAERHIFKLRWKALMGRELG